MEQKGTTRGGKRSQEVVNPGSLAVREKKRQMAPRQKRCVGSFVCFKYMSKWGISPLKTYFSNQIYFSKSRLNNIYNKFECLSHICNWVFLFALS